MRFSAFPFIRFLICLLLGRIIGYAVGIHIYIWFIFTVLLLIFLLFYIKPSLLGYTNRWWTGIIITLIFIVFGIILEPNYNNTRLFSDNKDVMLLIDAQRVMKNVDNKQSVLFDCYGEVQDEYVHCLSVAYLNKDDFGRFILPGDRFIIHTEMHTYKRSGNPFVFEYANYMKNKGIVYYFFFNKDDVVPLSSHHSAQRLFLSLRQKAEEHINALNLSDQNNAVIAALLLGDKNHLEDKTKDAFLYSGVMHVLAVSGLHLGILFLLLSSLLGSVRGSVLGVFKAVVIIIILWLYAAVSGFSLSIIRACIMFTVFLISKLVTKNYKVYHALSIAAFIIILLNPEAIIQVGFWLSFLAVTAIVYFYPIINKLFSSTKPWLRFLWNIISVSIAAQIGTLFLVCYAFGFLPTYFLISNILILPVLPFILIAALLIVLTPINGIVAQLCGGILSDGLEYMNTLTQYFSSLPHSSLTQMYLSFPEMLCLYAATFIFIVWTLRKTSCWFMLSLGFVSVALLFNIYKVIKVNAEDYFSVSQIRNKTMIIQTIKNSSVIYSNNMLSKKDINQIILPLINTEYIDSIKYNIDSISVLTPFETVDRRILCVNGECKNILSIIQNKNIDVIVITHNTPSSTINKLLSIENVKLVFDSSFSDRQIKKMMLLHKDLYFVSKQGAYVIKDIYAF